MTSRPAGECRDMELSLGVLVLGALEPAERPAVQAHLAQCPRCRAILAELAPLPGLLHRLDPIDHDMPELSQEASPVLSPVSSPVQSPLSSPAPEPLLGPPALRDRIVDAARVERKRGRRRWAAGLSAAAILLGVVVAGTLSGGWWDHGSSAQTTVASATDPSSAVRADVRLKPDGSGTALALRLTGVTPAEHCQLVAVDAQGHQQVAATWVATYEGRATITGHTSLQPRQIKRLLVVTDAGRMLVRVPISG
jgi:Putative zinc-finger